MGTNYYLRYDLCNSCSRYNELHIGKNSFGWKFVFQVDEENELVTYDRWVDFLKSEVERGSKIVDEYNKEISLEDFIGIVEEKQKDIKNKDHVDYNGNYLDVRSYNFCKNEFS